MAWTTFREFYGRLQISNIEKCCPKRGGGHITVSRLESWLHIIFMQLCDSLCYLHYKTIIHNEIKNDNVVIATGCSSFFFTSACWFWQSIFINDARKKKLSQEEKIDITKTFHIMPQKLFKGPVLNLFWVICIPLEWWLQVFTDFHQTLSTKRTSKKKS